MRANFYALILCLLAATTAKAQYYFLDNKITTTKTIGTNPYFGHSVAVSGDGNTMMIGATLDSGNRGTVFVYKKVNGSWVNDTTLTPVGHFPYPISSSYTNYGFGSDIALSYNGNTAIIGRAGDNDQGAVWVWDRGSNSKWSTTGRIGLPTNGTPYFSCAFGATVDISDDGNTAVVGAPNYNSTNGAIFVLTRSGSWYPGMLFGGGGNYGSGLAISGNGMRIAAGGPINSRMDYWDYSTSQGWTYKGYFGYMPPANTYLGSSLDLSYSGDTMVVGSINFGVSLSGAVTMAYDGTAWAQFGGDIKVSTGFLGVKVKMTNDGKMIALGLPYENNGGGGVAVTTLGANGTWGTPIQTIGGPAAGKNAHQGDDISISADGSVLVAGAYADNSGQGAAYVSSAAVPQITTGSISGSPFCESTSYNTTVSFTTNIKNGTFNAELSDFSGSFQNPTVIGTSSSSPIQAAIPSGIANGNQYRIRVKYAGNGNLNQDYAGTDNGADLEINTCPPAGINKIDVHNISAYPNPAHDVLHINNLQEDAGYCIYTTTGLTAQKGMVDVATGNINLNVPQGIYFLQLTQNGLLVATLKVAVQ